MKIGIFVKRPENIFSNGCVQQILFLKKIIDNIGYEVNLLSVQQDYTNFEITETPILYTNDKTDFSSYNCLIMGSLVLSYENNIAFITNLVSFGRPIINLICGNLFILHQEEFVFNQHNILKNYIHNYITENWVLEMYEYSKDYIRILSGKETTITPYVWDTDIIQEYVNKNTILNNKPRDHSKVNLLIFEPNMSIHKNSLIPLLICEEYYKNNKDKINKIYILCGDNVISNKNVSLLQNLELYKDSKLETYGRIITPYIIDVIEKNNDYLNIVVSYTLLNNLNFLHLEMFHLGVPIIHNCEPFQNNEMYYNDFEMMKAVDLIENVRVTFDKSVYTQTCKNMIDEYNPSNESRILKYKALLSKFENNVIIEEEVLVIEEESLKLSDYSDKSMFYQGSGYVINLEDSKSDENDMFLKKYLEIISENKELTYIEVFHKANINKNIYFNDLLSVSFIQTDNLSKNEVIKNSSFRVVKYIHFKTNISSDDIETYTK
jgi:hypothetical protein